jgi:hypothetical protein
MSSPAGVDILVSWAERIAAVAAPDEIDLAPDIAAAYAKGGAAHRQLFGRPRADPGAFGAGSTVVLPYLLDALEHCYQVVRGVLMDPAFNSAIASASLLVAIRQSRQNRKGTRREGEDQRPATDAAPSAPPPQEDVASALEALNAVTERLVDRGVPTERAAVLAAGIMRTMAEDQAGATEFLDLLAARRR